MDPNELLLKAVRSRGSKKTKFAYGILTADRYVMTLQDRLGIGSCRKYFARGDTSFGDMLKQASKTLVYSNPEMKLEEKLASTSDFPKDVKVPKNTLIVFKHTLTTNRKDRDGDVLHPEGMEVDPKMLMLWQHMPTMPIGKFLAKFDQTKNHLKVYSCIVDMNSLCHDAAVMIDSDMGRFSHGFRATDFTKMKSEDPAKPDGFEVKSGEIMEESLVSVPANIDSQTEEVLLSLVEGGKLTSPVMKRYGRVLREKRPVQVAVKYAEKLGDYHREFTATSFEELKKAVELGIISGKVDEDENEQGTRAGEKGFDSTGSPKETKGIGDEEQKGKEGETTNTEGMTVKDAMAFFLSKSTQQERLTLKQVLDSIELSEKKAQEVKRYRAAIARS